MLATVISGFANQNAFPVISVVLLISFFAGHELLPTWSNALLLQGRATGRLKFCKLKLKLFVLEELADNGETSGLFYSLVLLGSVGAAGIRFSRLASPDHNRISCVAAT